MVKQLYGLNHNETKIQQHHRKQNSFNQRTLQKVITSATVNCLK